MTCCREVAVLRSLVDNVARSRACDRLLRRYVTGRRAAADVVDGLQALYSQNRRSECSSLLTGAFSAVQPVPTVLWLWACSHPDALHVDVVRYMLRLGTTSPRLDKHLRTHRHKLAQEPEGLVALLAEHRRMAPWGVDAAARGMAMYGAPWPNVTPEQAGAVLAAEP